MDRDRYNSNVINFYTYNFYLENIPLEIYKDEQLGVKCAIMKSSDDPDEIMIASIDRPLVREYEPPVQVVMFASRAFLDDKESMKLLKEFHHELMERVYEDDYFNGSISYPGMFQLSEEFTKRFNKVAYALQIRNGGDAFYIEMETEDEDRVAYIVAPMFLNQEQYDEYKKLLLVDEDDADNYVFDLDDNENISTLK